MINRGILWVTSVALSIIGLVDSTYLTWIKITHNEALCIQGVGNCFTVNTSSYSEWRGIPVAVIGLLGYVIILAILMAESRFSFVSANGPLAIFGLSLIGVVFSAYLTFIEVSVIKAICPFCVVSAIAMLVLFVVALVRLARSQQI